MEHIFCEYCGKKLISRFVFDHYDKRDGQKLYRKFLCCPSRRWWNLLFHDNYFVFGGSFGDHPIYYTESYIQNEEAREVDEKQKAGPYVIDKEVITLKIKGEPPKW